MVSISNNDRLPSSKSKVHVLALPVPAQGHMSPMMHLSKHLAAEPGITVSFINVDSVHEQMMKHWIAPEGLNLRLDSIPFSWKTPNGFDAECLANLGKWFRLVEDELPAALTDLISRLSSEFGKVSCIISDYYFPWSQDVADQLGIPRVILWSGNAAWTSLEYHIPDLLAHDHIFPAEGRVPLNEAKSIVVDYIRGLTPLVLADVPDYMLSSGDLEFVEFSKKRYPYVKRASWVLVNSFYELEKPAFDFMTSELGSKLVPAGPMFLLDQGSESGPKNVVLRTHNDDCIRWLDQQERNSVLYISFGSLAVLTVEQFQELAAAVEQSGKSYLWVIKPELVVGGASQELYSAFYDRTRGQGMVVPWAPQLQVLEHPAVAAFLTHCGWNSILESICNGVPMICWPYGAEQNTNGKLVVEDWKIGVRFPLTAMQGLIERGYIEAAIHKLMSDVEMKQRAETLKSFGRKAMDKNGAINKLMVDAEVAETLRAMDENDGPVFQDFGFGCRYRSSTDLLTAE